MSRRHTVTLPDDSLRHIYKCAYCPNKVVIKESTTKPVASEYNCSEKLDILIKYCRDTLTKKELAIVNVILDKTSMKVLQYLADDNAK